MNSLNNTEVYNKLLKTYHKHGNLYVAFDFDDTVRDFETGLPIEPVLNALKNCALRGFKLILFTCREGTSLQKAVDWCKEQGISPTYINSNPETMLNGRKPYYNILLDDKAGLSESLEVLNLLLKAI